MKQCVNNTIQKYMEEGIKKFELKETDSLYEIYKNIRTTMAEKGMILVKTKLSYYDTLNEYMLTNPKTIACSLIYYWAAHNGYGVTQEDVSDYFNIHTTTLRKAGRILEKYCKDLKLEFDIHQYERQIESN